MELHPTERFPEELAALLASLGEPAFRARQLFRWIHVRGDDDPGRMRNLPPRLRRALAEAMPPVARADGVLESADGTRKLVVRFPDGAAVETVLMGGAREGALTQCLSTQVGCAMGCVFCHSGIAGLARHLSAAEILAQVRLARPLLRAGERLSGVVYMGMGEPLHNYDAVVRSVRLLLHPEGLALSARRVTISTVGLPAEMDRLGRDLGGKVGLAVSLHAGSSAARRRLLPIDRRHPIESVVDAIRRWPLPPRRRITIEYTLVAGENDALAEADALASLVAGLPIKVNLIPLNPHAGTPLGPPAEAAVSAFQERLAAKGLSVFVRRRRGDDIAAACGQLALRGALAGTRRAPASIDEGDRLVTMGSKS
jgi:23S rRNA (adenine2503-C2)-methyltransferase